MHSTSHWHAFTGPVPLLPHWSASASVAPRVGMEIRTSSARQPVPVISAIRALRAELRALGPASCWLCRRAFGVLLCGCDLHQLTEALGALSARVRTMRTHAHNAHMSAEAPSYTLQPGQAGGKVNGLGLAGAGWNQV